VVSLKRDVAVASELWNSVGRNIAPGAAARVGDDEVLVPLERFLAARNWLGRALTTYRCTAVLDPALLALLEREDNERAEVRRALAGEIAPTSADFLAELLGESRFCRELRPFQERDLARVLSLSHGANFSVPGAGKTSVTYAVYEAERSRGRVDRLLVVAPLSAFDAWVEEAGECLSPTPVVGRVEQRPPHGAEVVLINYQRLSSRYDQIAPWVLAGRTHVVLDEAHRMKRGRNGEWGTACLDLSHMALRRDILTGTPAPQHPSDFVALMEFLWPHQSRRILPSSVYQSEPAPTTMAEVSRSLAPLFARTRKDELGLDKPLLRIELVEMKPLQAEIYQALRTQMRRAVDVGARERAMIGEMGAVVMYLLQAATNPALLARVVGGKAATTVWPPEPIPASSTMAEQILSYSRAETPRKLEKLAAMVASNAERGRKTLVWANFVDSLRDLQRVLAPFDPALIYGAVPSGEELEGVATREGELRRFREDGRCMVLLANPAAMSEGVSLHHVCHDAIYLDRTFNAGQYLQSIDRIHRLGLEPGTDTRITFLVSAGTIDEIVDDRIRVKAERLAEMLSDRNLVTMALPDEEATGSSIDPEDLDALFGHLTRT
jgi:SNF2-related domain/Helicase conserved C-terminal domain